MRVSFARERYAPSRSRSAAPRTINPNHLVAKMLLGGVDYVLYGDLALKSARIRLTGPPFSYGWQES